MNTQEKVKALAEKLVSRGANEDVTAHVLAELQRLEKELGAIGETTEERIRMPYSTMPILTSRCWK